MKTGEHWIKSDGSVWKIIRLTRTTLCRDSRKEGVEIECVRLDKPTTPEGRLLMNIFGSKYEIGETFIYTRSAFVQMFSKVY